MSTLSKTLVSLVLALAITGAIYGAYRHADSLFASVHGIFGVSSQGSTGSTARQFNVFGVNLASAGANATSSSVLNNTGNDLYVTAVKAGCENVGTSKTAYTGAGLSALTFSVGTTSTAAPAVVPTNLIGGSAFTVATASPYFLLASSTNGAAGSNGIGIWPANSYMTFFTNATNTAVCSFSVDAFSS